MRSSPIFSETRFSLSFFLTTPAKNPRTECCCQSVAFMIEAIVAPLGCRSIPSTVSCLEVPDGLAAVCFGAAVLEVGADLLVCLAVERVGGRRTPCFCDFGCFFLIAIWLSWMTTTASCGATDTSPVLGGAG